MLESRGEQDAAPDLPGIAVMGTTRRAWLFLWMKDFAHSSPISQCAPMGSDVLQPLAAGQAGRPAAQGQEIATGQSLFNGADSGAPVR